MKYIVLNILLTILLTFSSISVVNAQTMNNPLQGGCIDTAVGCINVTDTNAFIGDVLKLGIGIGGGVAMFFIIYASFLIITSQGDPKRLKEGQEMVTSAIMGIIMLIFSVTILELIGVEILKIPNF